MTVPDVCRTPVPTMPGMSQIIATVGVLTLYVFAAAFDERPEMMLVGLSPLSLVAAETVWHLFGDFASERT
jgi:hypothetical protein